VAAAKFAPQKGTMPVLQFCAPGQLKVDPTYQRELDEGSRVLIGQIARGWDWNLYQPLVVARRQDGQMFVVDGQHRLEAARMRGDIQNLPAVIFHPAHQTEEAAVFVELNGKRRPLTAYAMFNAAIASGDEQAQALADIMRGAGLGFTGSADLRTAKPGKLNNVHTVRKWHARHGDVATRYVLGAIGRVYGRQTITIASLLFVGVGAVVLEQGDAISSHLLADVLDRTQDEWLADFRRRAADEAIGNQLAAMAVLRAAYSEARAEVEAE